MYEIMDLLESVHMRVMCKCMECADAWDREYMHEIMECMKSCTLNCGCVHGIVECVDVANVIGIKNVKERVLFNKTRTQKNVGKNV